MPKRFACDGEGVRPELHISGVPDETRSLALLVDDLDAPGGTFTHWVAWNIPPKTEKILSDTLPEGMKEGVNSSGQVGYLAPCPPQGTHRYIFTLYALDTILEVEEDTKEKVLEAITDHIITQTELVGLYCRDESR